MAARKQLRVCAETASRLILDNINDEMVESDDSRLSSYEPDDDESEGDFPEIPKKGE